MRGLPKAKLATIRLCGVIYFEFSRMVFSIFGILLLDSWYSNPIESWINHTAYHAILLRVLMNKITCLIILNTTFVLAGALAPTSSCLATASLDEEYTQTNPVKTESPPINKPPKNFNNPNLYESVQNLRFDNLKQEPEILNLTCLL